VLVGRYVGGCGSAMRVDRRSSFTSSYHGGGRELDRGLPWSSLVVARMQHSALSITVPCTCTRSHFDFLSFVFLLRCLYFPSSFLLQFSFLFSLPFTFTFPRPSLSNHFPIPPLSLFYVWQYDSCMIVSRGFFSRECMVR